MKLVIAEKPSVAMLLAAVLGANEKKDGYMEGGGYLVSWCVGHLLELAQPEAYGEQYARWRYGDLPILPEEWKYEVPKDKKKHLDLLCRLMKDKRVESVVCATDAGREGELIFRLVYEYAGCSKPMERLWISSMEDAAIRDGFEHLRPGSDYDKLYDAAVCRAGADWLIGINATRLFSVLYGVTLNVGRVMCVQQVLQQFDPGRIFYVLANTVRQKDYDGRISRDNKAWAQTIPVCEDKDGFGYDRNVSFVVDRSHTGLMDLFLTQARREYALAQEKPSVRDSLNKSAGQQAAHSDKPKMKKEQAR